MKADTCAVRYQHSLFLVVTFLSMGVYGSLSAQFHQAHAGPGSWIQARE